MEDLLTNQNLMIKSWRIDELGSEEIQGIVKQYLVYMRRSYVKKVILVCNRKNTDIIFKQVSKYHIIIYNY